MAGALGSLTGVALQRQLLLDRQHEDERREQELKRARDIQRSLLPESDPSVPGFEVAGWSEAAHETGGDFYDYLTLPDGRICIVVADVEGHGFESALVACETRALVRGVATHTSDLDAIVRRTNQLLYSDLRQGRLVTMFVGALDISASRLHYVSAGCGPLFYRHETGSCNPMPATVMPLAIMGEIRGPLTAEVDFQPGDFLALLSDGLYEWEDTRKEQYGIERICALIRHHHHEAASELIRVLHRAVSAFTWPEASKDDLTAVLIKRV
jgi:sigma-B regulation protein RsbU (phosphoserine phosphatase)